MGAVLKFKLFFATVRIKSAIERELAASRRLTRSTPGHSDQLLVQGNWGSRTHDVAVTFLNDAWSPGVGDRNLYVDSATYNGADVASAKHALLSGAFHFDL
jgi:hypothetical protein